MAAGGTDPPSPQLTVGCSTAQLLLPTLLIHIYILYSYSYCIKLSFLCIIMLLYKQTCDMLQELLSGTKHGQYKTTDRQGDRITRLDHSMKMIIISIVIVIVNAQEHAVR